MRSRAARLANVIAIAASLGACSEDPTTFPLDFRQSDQGWEGGFADYPVGEDAFYELLVDYRPLPAPIESSGSGLFATGQNRSDDLWMYYRGRVAGLSADTRYRVSFELQIATDAPSGCLGVGGAPGEGVTVKAGVSATLPDRVDESGFWRMNVDKGQQSQPGRAAVVLGDLANGRPCGARQVWVLKPLRTDATIDVTTDRTGAVWLFVGTDSGFEARSDVYFTTLTATFDPV